MHPTISRAAPSDVGNRVHPLDSPLVAPHVIEHQAFAKCQVAQRQVFSAETPENRVEQHGSRDHQVCSPGVETRQQESLLEIEAHRRLPHPPDLLGCDA